MIEYCRAEFDNFREANEAFLTLHAARFYEYRVKINGIEYDVNSNKCEEIWNKEITWQRLQQ